MPKKKNTTSTSAPTTPSPTARFDVGTKAPKFNPEELSKAQKALKFMDDAVNALDVGINIAISFRQAIGQIRGALRSHPQIRKPAKRGKRG